MNLEKVNNDGKNLKSSIILSALLSLIFINSYEFSKITYHRTLRIVFAFIIVFFIMFFGTKILTKWEFGVKLDILKDKIIEHRKQIFFVVITYVCGLILGYLIECITSVVIEDFNLLRLYCIDSVIIFALSIYYLNKYAKGKIELLFLASSLILGSFIISVTPQRVGVSWDDEIHYKNTLMIANSLTGISYEADTKQIEEYVTNIENHLQYDRDSKKLYAEELQDLYEYGEIGSTELRINGLSYIAYIPSVIGIIFARGLNLSYGHIFGFGRFFNLLFYSLLFYFAIRKIRYGKVFLACIGLIPTSLFMASAYSYDPWINGFTALGYGYFFSMIQSEGERFNKKDYFVSLLCLTIGCFPKAVYFPLLIPLLYFAFDKNNSKETRKFVLRTLILAALFLIASFVLPSFISGVNTDTRGGFGDVNGGEQVRFILSNPLQFVVILFNFMKDYLALENSSGYLQMYAYVGNGKYFAVILVALVVTMVLDFRSLGSNSFIRIACLLASLGSAIMAATAMYVAFTTVGNTTVLGCQPRYLLPALVPGYYVFSTKNVSYTGSRELIATLSMTIFAAVIFLNMWNLTISIY